MLTTERVKKAIRALSSHKTPGEDGFPTDWYCAFANQLAPILAADFLKYAEEREIPEHMKKAVITPLYKKGISTLWENYRPVAVTPAEMRIMDKTIQLALNEELHYIIGGNQVGFQRHKYIGEATALAQLIIARCKRRGYQIPGLMLLVDGEKVYDRVQPGWLDACLHKMSFPEEFRTLIKTIQTETRPQ